MYLVNALQEDGKRHMSSNYVRTLCGLRVGWELPKTTWKKRPPCVECAEKS